MCISAGYAVRSIPREWTRSFIPFAVQDMSSVRLIDLPRTSSFRLAFLFLLLFGIASSMLFGFLFWQTGGYLVSRMDDWLQREQASFAYMEREETLKNLSQ